jgi:hypothetical protein
LLSTFTNILPLAALHAGEYRQHLPMPIHNAVVRIAFAPFMVANIRPVVGFPPRFYEHQASVTGGENSEERTAQK